MSPGKRAPSPPSASAPLSSSSGTGPRPDPQQRPLENAVTNWTYTSRAVRFTITVGVAYGSDTRRVIQLRAT